MVIVGRDKSFSTVGLVKEETGWRGEVMRYFVDRENGWEGTNRGTVTAGGRSRGQFLRVWRAPVCYNRCNGGQPVEVTGILQPAGVCLANGKRNAEPKFVQLNSDANSWLGRTKMGELAR